ncbi:hypothetical protein EUX98_g5184 [Antrodiella citrinella]|uniref:Uncharacterized protein n=1 Tax=Antrodiella citrinella TaxID=2447956 RepID=A0A4V3XIG8_9APHY|nr:hypothetical protein EUX98_g5184 [Antrodiella citrinella]
MFESLQYGGKPNIIIRVTLLSACSKLLTYLIWFGRCRVLMITPQILTVLSDFGVAAFTALRAWAVCGKINIFVYTVFLFSIFVPCVNIVSKLDSRCALSGRPRYLACSQYNFTSLRRLPGILAFPILTRSMAVLSDLVVLVITYIKTADVVGAKTKNFRPELSMLLIRNGAVYFSILSVLNAITVVLDIFGRNRSGPTGFIMVNEA